jgi:hypothetical protein
MLPVNRGSAGSDTEDMPIGHLCRACGAALPPDLGWCAACYAPVRLYSPREPVREPGGYAGRPMPALRTSRWRQGPTSFGPLGRILSTAAVVALFPWWGLGGNPFFLWSLMGWLGMAGIVLRSIWKRERIVDPSPTRVEKLRARHPFLAQEIRLSGNARTLALVVVAGGAAAAWLSFDTGARFLLAVVVLVAGVGIFLSSRHDL